jgi:MerR family transcriptional regulator/heat shock protein HspR
VGKASKITEMNQDYFHRRQIIEIFEIDEKFLRGLEDEELVHPVQVDSIAEEVFPIEEVERIRIIHNLMNELEVNLPGVEVILEMRRNMIRMQEQFNVILETLISELKERFRV